MKSSSKNCNVTKQELIERLMEFLSNEKYSNFDRVFFATKLRETANAFPIIYNCKVYWVIPHFSFNCTTIIDIDVVNITDLTAADVSIAYQKLEHYCIVKSYSMLNANYSLKSLFDNDNKANIADRIANAETQAFILKPMYATRSANSLNPAKSDVQTAECLAIARMIDTAAVHKRKVALVVSDSMIEKPIIVNDVVCCNSTYCNNYITANNIHGILYVVCSTLSCDDKQMFKKHMQIINNWQGHIVWLYYDLRLMPKFDMFNFKAKSITICTQAKQLTESMKNKLSLSTYQQDNKKHSPRITIVENFHLHAIPLFYKREEDYLQFKRMKDALPTVSYPMVAWKDNGSFRQNCIEQLFNSNDIDVKVHICGNIAGLPQIYFDKIKQGKIVYHGTIKCSNIIDWNQLFDFAYILTEQNMHNTYCITFRAIEAFIAGVPALFVNNALMPCNHLLAIQQPSDIKYISKKQVNDALIAQDAYLIELKHLIKSDIKNLFSNIIAVY